MKNEFEGGKIKITSYVGKWGQFLNILTLLLIAAIFHVAIDKVLAPSADFFIANIGSEGDLELLTPIYWNEIRTKI